MTASLRSRRTVDSALGFTFIGAWATHEAGVVVHSLISLTFAAVALLHARANWQSLLRTSWRHHTLRAVDVAVIASVVAVTATGVSFWIVGSSGALGHGLIAFVVTAVIATHLVAHRRMVLRVVGYGRRSRGARI